MIKNEKHYRITRAQAERFARTLQSMREQPSASKDLHPVIARAQEDALASQLADLEVELIEYEALKAGAFQLDELKVVADLPAMLIKARIAQGLSQKDLAVKGVNKTYQWGGAKVYHQRGHWPA